MEILGKITAPHLENAALSSTGVETWTEDINGTVFVCFRNQKGELFHFKKATLLRGKIRAPYRNIEEFTRPAGMLTLENAHHISGCSPHVLKHAIRNGKLPAIKKLWRWGNQRRMGLLVNIDDLQEFVAKRAIAKYKGRDVIWDIPSRELLDLR